MTPDRARRRARRLLVAAAVCFALALFAAAPSVGAQLRPDTVHLQRIEAP